MVKFVLRVLLHSPQVVVIVNTVLLVMAKLPKAVMQWLE